MADALHDASTADWGLFGGSYYDEVEITRLCGNSAGMRYWRQTLEGLSTELLAPGFVLECLVEPRPVSELETVDPERYATLNSDPCFLGIRLRRPIQ